MPPVAIRPLHFRLGAIALVMVGGIAGSAAREGLVLAVPAVAETPVAIAMVNISGAFMLGVLYATLSHRSRPGAFALTLNLLLGTGFCGGFTTYSALAAGTLALMRGDAIGLATLFALGSVLIGGLATWAGIVVGIRLSARGERPRRIGEVP
ncbi:fluoride efflux transporter FluC [Agromyces laixinhei]|uniref:fluoride efflux transporter FluC n=1 Tax=Agromyces laixinhei TaxID=2585717 RepID=UPI001E2E1594|nr:CrcB family protein [Agromyces laixinhei]